MCHSIAICGCHLMGMLKYRSCNYVSIFWEPSEKKTMHSSCQSTVRALCACRLTEFLNVWSSTVSAMSSRMNITVTTVCILYCRHQSQNVHVCFRVRNPQAKPGAQHYSYLQGKALSFMRSWMAVFISFERTYCIRTKIFYSVISVPFIRFSNFCTFIWSIWASQSTSCTNNEVRILKIHYIPSWGIISDWYKGQWSINSHHGW